MKLICPCENRKRNSSHDICNLCSHKLQTQEKLDNDFLDMGLGSEASHEKD